MRIKFILLAIFLAPVLGVAQEDFSSTLIDNVATLDVTTVTGETSARSVIIREEVAQQLAIPSVATRTVLSEEDREWLLPSVDTISGAEIRTYQRYDLEGVLRQSAGVGVVSTGQSGSQTSIFIRGMESNHTVVLLNGRRLPPGLAGLYQIEYLDVSNLESVQITRGAASSLYGSDALGGAIDLRTTDARFVEADTLSTYAEAGSFNTFRSGGKLTVRDGAVGISLDGSFLDTKNDRIQSDYDNATFRGNVSFELGDGIYFDILASVQNSFLEVPGSSLDPDFPQPQVNENQSGLFSPRFSIIRDDWDFTTFYSYTTNELTAKQAPFFSDSKLDQTGNEWEAVFNYRPSDDATLTLGAGHYQYAFERIQLIPSPFNQPAAFDYSFTSAFAQADLELPAHFHLLTSGRYDAHDSFESRATYTVQLSHEVEATGTTVFGKVATGYKAPSGQDFIFLAPGIDPTTIAPEESLTWELGLRQTVFNERSSLSLTYFQNEVENLIDVDPFTFVDPAVVDTESDGVELEFVYSPCEGVDFYANYTYLDTLITDGLYFGGFSGTVGDRLARRPAHTLGAGLVLTGDTWNLGAEITGAYDRFDGPGVFLDDYTVARIFGSREISENVEIYGRLENVFDLDYQTTTGFEASGLGAFAGVRFLIGQ